MSLLKRISNIIKKSYKYFCIYNEKFRISEAQSKETARPVRIAARGGSLERNARSKRTLDNYLSLPVSSFIECFANCFFVI